MLLSSYSLPRKHSAEGSVDTAEQLIASALPWLSTYSSSDVSEHLKHAGKVMHKAKLRDVYECKEYTIYASYRKLLIFKPVFTVWDQKSVHASPIAVRVAPFEGGYDLQLFHKHG
ncbi:hypothetical protein IWQ57_000242 [Coemansia nantahalensis]|uniref:Uncharacterized protein n=1 Tax=Coemansia nantahalensis TaxID=2789366 RepID=A0ACC1K8J5_9FUNG|nr:hypothetical protein IWQ57_000242 [Coemansia nantahalensis]